MCYDTHRIQKDHESICRKCGTVCDIIQPEEFNLSSPHTTSHRLGSENIIDSKLKLVHINKKKTRIIMEHHDKQLSCFISCCDVLNLRKFVVDTALEMFRRLRPYKFGIGKTAVFCIYHACMVSEVLCNSDEIIKTVRHRFALKRIIEFSDVLYTIKPTAIEQNLILPGDLSDSFVIKKHVMPKHHVKAVKIIDSFCGDKMKKKADAAQRYLECYD